MCKYLEFREWIGAENTNKLCLRLFMLFKTMKEMIWELQSELNINQGKGARKGNWEDGVI